MISVAIITYNHEKYIKTALDSVISQTYDMNDLEIIVGDDGSTDDTVDILKEYEDKIPFMHVFAHDNWGISKNIYHIFQKCKGEFIAVLEGDDYWIDKEKLNKQLEIIRENDCLAVASNVLIVDKDGKPSEGKLHNEWKSHIFSFEEIQKYQTQLFYPSTLLFKNIFLNSGDRYSIIRDASKYGGSHSGMINLLGTLGNIYYFEECLAAWRKVTSGGSNYSSMKHTTIYDLYDQLNKYFIYSKAFKFNYSKNIKYYYSECVLNLCKDTCNYIGKKKAFIYTLYACLRSLKKIITNKEE